MSAATPLVIENLRGPRVGPVSFVVAPGTCAVISGPSGAGKSLLLRMIADLDPSEGAVRLGDVRREAIAAPAWRRLVTYVAAESGWWAQCGGAHFSDDGVASAKSWAAGIGLTADTFDRPIVTLSTGEKQRLALLRALARRPKILLLDEPTSGVDPACTGQVEALIRERLAAGLAAVVVTHDAAQARRLGTQHYAMSDGRVTSV